MSLAPHTPLIARAIAKSEALRKGPPKTTGEGLPPANSRWRASVVRLGITWFVFVRAESWFVARAEAMRLFCEPSLEALTITLSP